MDEQYLKALLIAFATHLYNSCETFLAVASDSNFSDLLKTDEFQILCHSSEHLSYILSEIEKIDESLNEIRNSLNHLSIDLDEQ